jgi:hypothetical protein
MGHWGLKSVKNIYEWALGLGIGSGIPVICADLESSGRYKFEKIFKILLLHSVRSQFRPKIGSKNVKKFKIIKNTHSTYQNVQLGELITTTCLFLSFVFFFGSLGAKKCEKWVRTCFGLRSWLSHPSDLWRFRKLCPLRI